MSAPDPRGDHRGIRCRDCGATSPSTTCDVTGFACVIAAPSPDPFSRVEEAKEDAVFALKVALSQRASVAADATADAAFQALDALIAAVEAASAQRLVELERELSETRDWVDVLTHGKSPCGHWKVYAVTDDPKGASIACLQCRAEQAEAQLATVLQERDALQAQVAGCVSCSAGIELDAALRAGSSPALLTPDALAPAPHAFAACTDLGDYRDIWCRECPYHRDHPIHSPSAPAPTTRERIYASALVAERAWGTRPPTRGDVLGRVIADAAAREALRIAREHAERGEALADRDTPYARGERQAFALMRQRLDGLLAELEGPA